MEYCSNISVGPAVTQKFFNYDNNYELMVMLNYKPIGEYGAIPFTEVFSLSGATTPAEKIKTIPGYYISAVNAATDAWSEDFYITFFSGEEYTETQMLYTFDIYSKATYSNPEATLIKSFTEDMVYVMSDGENEGFPVVLNAGKGGVYIAVSKFEKTFFENPFDYTNDKLSEDNHYLIDLYKVSGYSTKTVELVSHTSIPCESPEGDFTMRSYCLGRFSLQDDVTFDFSDNATPDFILTVTDSNILEETETYFAVYNTAGEMIKSFGQNSEAFILLGAIKGHPEQYCFAQPDANGQTVLNFMDYPSCELRASIPSTVTIDGEPFALGMNLGRVAGGNCYRYAVAGLNGDNDPETGVVFHPVAWFDNNGIFEKMERVIGGSDAVYMNLYMGTDGLSPFTFNTDNLNEYLAFVLRNTDHGSSRSQTHLIVVNSEGQEHFDYAFPLTSSSQNAALVNGSTNPAIWISYYDSSAQTYHSEFINLPLNALEGDGSAANPYVVSTAGDFALIKNNLKANYILGSDINFEGAQFEGFSGTFTGSLDGNGHQIKNIVLNGNSVFNNTGEAGGEATTIKNITFNHVKVTEANAVVASNAYNTVFENIYVGDLNVDNTDTDFGTIVNDARLGSKIIACGVTGTINAPEAMGVGGIVCSLSGSSVEASSFNGSITGSTTIGGIAASIDNASASISDCHVNATIEGGNRIGGIAGTSARGLVSRCLVEGSIKATRLGQNWSDVAEGFVKMVSVGGILGSLSIPTPDDNMNYVFNTAVENNVVALSEITIPSDADEKAIATAHRIVGFTVANNDPQILGETYNPSTYEWEITWGDPFVETGIVNNYAFSDLAPLDATVAAGTGSAEGQNLDAANADDEFWTGLGFQFNGYSAAQPWIFTYTVLPALYFESYIGADMYFDPAVISLKEGETTNVLLVLEGIEFDSLIIESSDENGCYLNPVELDDDGVVCEVVCLREGSYTLTATNGRLSATLTVTGLSGIDQVIVPAASAITFDGYSVNAAGSALTIYNISGMSVAAGRDSIDVTSLSAGVYVAVATDADGHTSTLKFAVK